MIVMGGSASGRIAEGIGKELGIPVANCEFRRFPDGEGYIRILDDISKEDYVIAVQTTYPDSNIVELFIMHDAIMEWTKNAKIITVVPYMGYSRQDKIFLDGEAISARAILHHIELYSDAMIFVDLHSSKILEFTTKRSYECTAMEVIAEYFKDKGIDFVLSPDKGAIERARKVALNMGLEYDYLEKTRIDGTTVKMRAKNLDVNGKRVLIVDDIISTGGTIIKATESLKASGATEVYAVCTHGLYTNNALEHLRPVLNGIYSTDTIESETSVISVAKPISDAIREIIGGI